MEDDYEKWIYYLSQSSSWSTESEVRTAFETYLTAYPWDASRWSNFAMDLYRVTGSVDKSIDVFTTATTRLAYCPAVWCDFLTYVVDTHAKLDFEQMVHTAVMPLCGHPDAGEFWKLAFCLLRANGNLIFLLEHFYLVLSCPSPYLSDLYDLYKDLSDTVIVAEDSVEARGFNRVLGEDTHRVRHLMTSMRGLYEGSVTAWSSRVHFEGLVKRREYCHSALPTAEVDAWHDYLTFEQQQSGWCLRDRSSEIVASAEGELGAKLEELVQVIERNRMVRLFERCLLPCALYPGQ